MSSYYDRAFRGWVSVSSAKDRAFAGWIAEEVASEIHMSIDASLAAPSCTMHVTAADLFVPLSYLRIRLPRRTFELRIAGSIAAPTSMMRLHVIDYNYLSALAELDADVAEALLARST